MIFLEYARALHVCILTIKLCHDFTIDLSRKSCAMNCLNIIGYYPVNWLGKMQISGYYKLLISALKLDGTALSQ